MFKRFALIAITFMGLTYNAQTLAATPGWAIDKLEGTKVVSIENVGDKGGVLNLSCSTETHRVKLDFLVKGKKYDFFIVRRFGDISDSTDKKLLIGSTTVSVGKLIKNIGQTEGGFEIIYYPVGTKALWEAQRDANNPYFEFTIEDGEFFITGNVIKQALADMVKSCELDLHDETPMF